MLKVFRLTFMKFVYISLFLIMCSHEVFSQKKFQITFKLDSSISPQNVRYQYDDGKIKMASTTEGVGTKREITLRGNYFAPYATFEIWYAGRDKEGYRSDFFIGDKPAEIDFYFKPNIDRKLLYHKIRNAQCVYDTVTNNTYRELSRYNRKENLAAWNFLQENKDEKNADSVLKIYMQMEKSIQLRSMEFLKRYSDDYFSFWYFKHNIASISLYDDHPDTAYLKEQMAYFKSAFPKKYTQSVEGRTLLKMYANAFDTLKINQASPSFTIKTIDNKNISLNNLKGKYVLLDFWATWCIPCMAEIPFIQEVRKNYDPKKLVIIGISEDRDIINLKKVISDKKMDWIHFYDKENEISRLYNVSAFPTLILLNKEGTIVYKSDLINSDKDGLTKALTKLN